MPGPRARGAHILTSGRGRRARRRSHCARAPPCWPAHSFSCCCRPADGGGARGVHAWMDVDARGPRPREQSTATRSIFFHGPSYFFLLGQQAWHIHAQNNGCGRSSDEAGASAGTGGHRTRTRRALTCRRPCDGCAALVAQRRSLAPSLPPWARLDAPRVKPVGHHPPHGRTASRVTLQGVWIACFCLLKISNVFFWTLFQTSVRCSDLIFPR